MAIAKDYSTSIVVLEERDTKMQEEKERLEALHRQILGIMERL